jgi:hypothetical protein
VGRARRRDSALTRPRLSWSLALALVFAVSSAWSVIVVAVAPGILGSHAAVYAEAARAWLTGGDPWRVGPPLVVFAGPPPMLLPYAPFAFVAPDVTRFVWVALDAAVSIWALRRLRLPAYWLAFPPLFEAIVLGHPEVLVLAFIVVGLQSTLDRRANRLEQAIAALSAVIKPYAALLLLAERWWWAFAAGAAIGVISALFLPWQLFLSELPMIGANIARQNVGDSTWGQPLLMAVAAAALLALGPRKALWLAVPVLLPSAQPIYKVMTIPMLPPVLALFWAIPIPGLTLVGLVLYAGLSVARRRPTTLPRWILTGLEAPLDRLAGRASATGLRPRPALAGTAA